MSEPRRVALEKIDCYAVLPMLRLVSAFKQALQPGKLLVAFLAVVAIHFSGVVLDAAFGLNEANDGPGEMRAYEGFIALESRAFSDLMNHGLALEHGFGPSDGVIDSARAAFIDVPVLLFETHPWFAVLFGLDVFFILTIASGLLCRMAATQVCAGDGRSLSQAASYLCKRWTWHVFTPLMPLALIAVAGALLALAGLALFNVPWLDVAGGLIYGPLVLLGFVIALIALLLVFAVFLIPPALSVEGSDGFDAIARSFNYVLFKPWQFAGYLLATAIYLAVVYVVVGTVASVSVGATHHFVSLGIVSDHHPTEPATWIMTRWLECVSAIALAIMLSTFCCLQTQVYVLMRRSADGTPTNQCDSDAEPQTLWQSGETTPHVADAPDTPATSDTTTKGSDAPQGD
jgi:hypothetical protein